MISIQHASVKDVPVIHSLAHSIWPEAYKEILSPQQMSYMLNMMYSHDSIEYQIQKQKHEFIIAYDDDEPVGFAAYFPKYKISESIYRLDKLYVLPNLHGKGIGKKLLDFIIAEIKPKGAAILELNVNRNNKAITFYQKLGFIIISEVDVPIGEGYFMNDYVMQREIIDHGS